MVYYILVQETVTKAYELADRLKGDAYQNVLRTFLPAFQKKAAFSAEAAVPKSTLDDFSFTHTIRLSGITSRNFNTNEYFKGNFRRAVEQFFHTTTLAGWTGEVVEARADNTTDGAADHDSHAMREVARVEKRSLKACAA